LNHSGSTKAAGRFTQGRRNEASLFKFVFIVGVGFSFIGSRPWYGFVGYTYDSGGIGNNTTGSVSRVLARLERGNVFDCDEPPARNGFDRNEDYVGGVHIARAADLELSNDRRLALRTSQLG
jgi:hypothetical protein